MLTLSRKQRVFVYSQATDMRKSFCGLSGLVAAHFPVQLTTGDLFVFFNRRLDSVKILAFDGDGLMIWYKRLESGTFQTSALSGQGPTLEIDSVKLQLLLQGIDLTTAKQRKRFISNTEADSKNNLEKAIV